MKTFHSIVQTVLQQGNMTTSESPAWNKEQLFDEVAWALICHEAFLDGEFDYPECNMTDDMF